jgi:hypothetical protein
VGLIGRLLGREPKSPVRVAASIARPAFESAEQPHTERVPVSPCVGSFDEWVETISAKFAPVTRSRGVKKALVYVDELAIIDLRSLPSKRTRIVGSANWVTDAERGQYGGTEYLFVREPSNQYDPSAVAVVAHGRKVGYLSAAKASTFANIFDPFPTRYDGYLVSGISVIENSIRLWVDVPSVPSMRAFVAVNTRRG